MPVASVESHAACTPTAPDAAARRMFCYRRSTQAATGTGNAERDEQDEEFLHADTQVPPTPRMCTRTVPSALPPTPARRQLALPMTATRRAMSCRPARLAFRARVRHGPKISRQVPRRRLAGVVQ